MSFIPFQQRCLDCKKHWNTVFGVVGTSILGPPCVECPHCHSKRIVKHADGWSSGEDPENEMLWGDPEHRIR